MNYELQDFIAVYSDVLPEGYCEHMIAEFERLNEMGAGISRQEGEGAPRYRKDDMQVFLNGKNHELIRFNDANPMDMFFDALQRCYNHYSEEYSAIQHGQVRGTAFKMQRTDPGGGYHVWHGEQGSGNSANRVLVYMLYLNTLDDDAAGETEFLYQQRRIKPVANTMLLWPAAFTHAHRGNTVFGDKSKYIITGWFYYD